jgi:hypothetical protein
VLKDIASDPEKGKEYKKKLQSEMISAKTKMGSKDKEGVSLERRCHLKCMCDKCASDSPFMQKSCQDLASDDLSCPECGDVVCPTEQAKEANMKEMKCKLKCMCEACGEGLWRVLPMLEDQCKLMQDLPADTCDCSGQECPYTEETVKKESEDLKTKTESKREEMAEEVKKIKEEFEEKKANMKKNVREMKENSTLDEGKKKDLTTEVKCKFQCLCDKCDDLNPAVLKLCNDQPRIECGECDKSLQCPKPATKEETKQNACNMICLCQECKDHRDMKGALKDTCKKITGLLKSDAVKCDCDLADVDCSEIKQMKKKLKLMEERKKDDGPGKIKQKVKLWDEL